MGKKVPREARAGPGFGCGALVGLGLGWAGAISSLEPDWSAGLAGSLLLAVVCGLLSHRYGDRFLTALLRWLS